LQLKEVGELKRERASEAIRVNLPKRAAMNKSIHEGLSEVINIFKEYNSIIQLLQLN